MCSHPLLTTPCPPLQAERFVAAHHLRTEASFQAAHGAMRRADRWQPKLHACQPWPDTARLATTWDGDPQGGGEPAALRRAMREFGCCQTWQMCELQPVAPA